MLSTLLLLVVVAATSASNLKTATLRDVRQTDKQEHLRSQQVKILKAAPATTTKNTFSQATDAFLDVGKEPRVFSYPAHLRQVLNDHASGKRVLNLPDKNMVEKTNLGRHIEDLGTFLDMPNNEDNNVNVPLDHIDHIISTLDTFHAHREDPDITYGTLMDKIKKKKKQEASLTLLDLDLDEGEKDDMEKDARVTDLKYARHLDRTRTLTAQQHALIHDVGMYGQAERKAKEIAALLETSDVQEHAHNMNSATNSVTNTIDILNNFLEEAQMDSMGKSNMDSQEDRRSTLTEEEEKIKQQEQDKTDSGISADMRLGNIVIDKSKANSFLEQKVGGYYKCSWGSTVCGRKRVCLAWGSWSEEGEEVHEEEYYLNGEETREGIFNKDAKCNTGFYARGSDGKPCGQCQSGRYQDQITRSRSCKACSAGKFTGTTCQTSCQQCEPGRFNAHTGQSTCSNCPSSKYTGQSGQTSCTSCPTGKFHGTFGQTSVTSCVGVESLPYTWAVDFDGECNGHNYWKFGNGQARNEGRNLEERAQAVGLICSLNPNTAAL